MNEITKRYDTLRGIFVSSVKIHGRAECSAEGMAASKTQPVLDDNPCMKKLGKLLIGILTLLGSKESTKPKTSMNRSQGWKRNQIHKFWCC